MNKHKGGKPRRKKRNTKATSFKHQETKQKLHTEYLRELYGSKKK